MTPEFPELRSADWTRFDLRSCHRPRDLDNHQLDTVNIEVCGGSLWGPQQAVHCQSFMCGGSR